MPETAKAQTMQVHDDLAQIYVVAEWIHSNGGRLTDPLCTFDCAFRLHLPDGDVPVNPGDTVVLDSNGFHVQTEGE